MSEPPRLYLIASAQQLGPGFRSRIEAALDAGDVASVLLPTHDADAVSSLVAVIQARGVAALVQDHQDGFPEADGVHLASPERLTRVVRQFQPARIVGVGGLPTRDDAMMAGEAGADYLMFGDTRTGCDPAPLAERVDRVSWWADIFQVPCVAVAHAMEEVAPLAAAGADFIALPAAVWDGAGGPAVAIRAATAALEVGHAALLLRQGQPA